jgi:hypothetical protein
MADGKIHMAPVSPRFKEFTRVVARWWEQSILDREFFNTDIAMSTSKWWSGGYGAHPDDASGIFNADNPASNALSDKDREQGGELVFLSPIGPEGFQFGGIYGENYLNLSVSQWMAKHVSDAKAQRVLEIMDTKMRIRTGKEEDIITWLNWRRGKEGAHWDWSGEPFKSPIKMRAKEDIPEGIPAAGAFEQAYPVYDTIESSLMLTTPKRVADFYKWLSTTGPDGAFDRALRPYKFDLLKETKFADVQADKGAALDTMRDEYFAKVVKGEWDLDADWDAYVKRWMDAGGAELLAEVEKMPRTWDETFL